MSKATENQGVKKEERIPFKIELEEPVPFNPIATTKFITSTELAKLVSDLFHGVFADFEGCMFEIPVNQPGILPYFSLIFNHGEYDEGATVACELNGGLKPGDKSDVLTRIRYQDNQLRNGDRYFLTEDGKDVVKTILIPQRFNNGKPNWGSIVGEYSDNSLYTYYGQQPQYTKVSYIDPNRLCALIFGDKEGDDTVEYHVSVFGAMGTIPGQPSSNYMLSITKVSVKEITETYNKLGLGSISRIVK